MQIAEVRTAPTPAFQRRAARTWRGLKDYAFVLPAVIVVAAFIIYPIFYSLRLSLLNRHLLKAASGQFVGFETYRKILADPVTVTALKNTAIWVAGGTALAILIGFAIGMFLNLNFPLNGVLRGIVLIPWILPDVVVAAMWKWMLHTQMGIINDFLVRAHILPTPVAWLSSKTTVLPSLIFVLAWRLCPFISVMILSGLRGISQSLYEAAQIDGAGPWHRFLYISLPLLRYPLVIGTLLTAIWTMNNFSIVQLMTAGGPLNYSEIVPTLIYKLNFQYYRASDAAALSMINLVILLIVSGIYLYSFRRAWWKAPEEA